MPFLKLIHRAINPQKPNPVSFDVGNFTAFDVNPLSSAILTNEDSLKSNARDTTQLLINEFLSLPRSSTLEGVFIQLPSPTTLLPREKPVPFPHRIPTDCSFQSPNHPRNGNYLPRRREFRTRKHRIQFTMRKLENGFHDGVTKAQIKRERMNGWWSYPIDQILLKNMMLRILVL